MEQLKDLLGTKPNNSEEIPEEDPLDSDPTSGNPLEELDKVSKASPEKKKIKGERDIDSDLLKTLLITGDNSDGMFTPDEEPEKEEEKDLVKVQAKDTKPSEKYSESFGKDMMKHPEDYTIQTPRGEMSIAEAMRKGYDPITKRFNKDRDMDNIKRKGMEGLNPQDRNKLEELMNPASAKIAPKDAESLGIKGNSPLIDKGPKVDTEEPGIGEEPLPSPSLPTPPQQVTGENPQTPDFTSLLGGAK